MCRITRRGHKIISAISRRSITNYQKKNLITKNLWSKNPEFFPASQEELMLDWLDEPLRMRENLTQLEQKAQKIKKTGYSHIVLLGMGGSSISSLVFRDILSSQNIRNKFFILDSYHPENIKIIRDKINIKNTLFIISSKSGSTLEPNILYRYFTQELVKAGVEDIYNNFVAITDPISSLEQLAVENGFGETIISNPKIGGRYSGLSVFGLFPALLMELDVKKILEYACLGVKSCGPEQNLYDNPGASLGFWLFENCKNSGEKLCIYLDTKFSSFGLWLEQLIGESLGKNNTGIVPIIKNLDSFELDNNKNQIIISLEHENKNFNFDNNTKIIKLTNIYEIARVMYEFQFGVSIAGMLMGVHPFDQPDVESSKKLAKQELVRIKKSPNNIKNKSNYDDQELEIFADNLNYDKKHNYICVLSYLFESDNNKHKLEKIKNLLEKKYNTDIIIQQGPRYLHSTGQLYKGGKNSGFFIIITENYDLDFYDNYLELEFSKILGSQAWGDYLALKKAERNVILIRTKNKLENFDLILPVFNSHVRI